MVAVVAMVLMVSACAWEADKAHTAKAHAADASHSNATRSLPNLGIPPTPTKLSPSKYVIDEFKPSFAFCVGKGWTINNPAMKDHFSIYNRHLAKSDEETGAVLTFVYVQAVFDAQEPAEGNLRPKSKDLERLS